jgi:hypothetical protein
MRGLDPRINLSSKMMDCRVKPGNDNLVAIHANDGADNGRSYRYITPPGTSGFLAFDGNRK